MLTKQLSKKDKKMMKKIKSKLYLSSPIRKGQTIQKDGAQSHGPNLVFGILSSFKGLETENQKLIWRLDCRNGAMKKVEVRNFQRRKQRFKFFIPQFCIILYIAHLPIPLIKRRRFLEDGLHKPQGGKRWVTTLISQWRTTKTLGDGN